MKVLSEKFCALSTSPSWQAWLFHFNNDLYKKFIKQLQESRGCSQNRDIMIELLKEIDQIPGGGDKIIDFLEKHYPHILTRDEQTTPKPLAASVNEIFGYYNPEILTYPRRMIIEGEHIEQMVMAFVSNKIKSDYVVVGGKAFIEFLNKEDARILDKIPAKNWMVAAWRAKNRDK